MVSPDRTTVWKGHPTSSTIECHPEMQVHIVEISKVRMTSVVAAAVRGSAHLPIE